MQKGLYALVVLMLMVNVALAQPNITSDEEKNMKTLAAIADSGWTKGGTFTITSNLNYLRQWAPGGQSSLAGNSLLNYYFNYRKGKLAWDNNIIAAYGLLVQPLDQSPFKTDDKIDFTSKLGHKIRSNMFLAALVNLKTQFAPGYNFINGRPDYSTKISDFMAPAFGLASIGIDYKPSKVPTLSVFVSPTSFRTVVVLDQQLADAGQFGVTPATKDARGVVQPGTGKNLRVEVGAYLRVNYVKDLTKNINWNTTLELFSNYLKNPQNVDVSWQSLFTIKANKWLSTTVFTHIVYDDDTKLRRHPNDANDLSAGPGIQLKSIVGVGISFKL